MGCTFPFLNLGDSFLSMNLGFVEQHPKWEWFVVERFSADSLALLNGTTTALKRSTTNLRRFMGSIRDKKEWRLPMNLPRPLTPERDMVPIGDFMSLLLSPDAGAGKFQCACPRGPLSSPPRGRGWVGRIRFLDSIRDKFVVEPLPQGTRCRVGCHSQREENATRLGTADATPRRCLISSPFRGEDKGEGDFLLGAARTPGGESVPPASAAPGILSRSLAM